MPLKRKIRNLPEMMDQMSFFDPVYPNEDLLEDGNPRPTLFQDHQITQSNETLINEDQAILSTDRISIRLKQIQNSIDQARAMLKSMEKFKHIMPGMEQQREKLHTILSNLEEQKASYVNLLDVIHIAEEERFQNSADDDDLALRRNIEPPTHESLIGSLKSDTLNWQDQQSISPDEETDDDGYEKNLLLQKEQLRASQGQTRALQHRSSAEKPSDFKETDLLTDINHLRNRLKKLRDVYEKKYHTEEQHLNSSISTSNRLRNLQHIRDRLDELEQIVNYYQTDDDHEEDEEILVYDPTSSDLAAKRMELEQAKSALNQLQEMVKTIQPDQSSSSRSSTPRSQHRSISTPMRNYEENLNHSTNRRPVYQWNEDDLERQSDFSEDLDKYIQPRLKQSNVYASDTVLAKPTDDLNSQLREVSRCFSTFIDEQKTFNRQIEQRLTNASNSPSSPDPAFSQLQQQVLTQGLIVNLNTAYREIAVLQSDINALQSENTRLSTSLSFDHRHQQSKSFAGSEDNLTATVLNIQPSTTHTLENVDVQTLDLQVKSIMVQLIPYLRLHINEIFTQSTLNHIRERVLFLSKQQSDSAEVVRRFQNEFSQALARAIEKYSGTTIRDCAGDLIRDISDVTFDQLVKYQSINNNDGQSINSSQQ